MLFFSGKVHEVKWSVQDVVGRRDTLRNENKNLKIAYAELAIDHKLSEKVLEKADEMMGLDLKKKYEQALSQKSKKK